VARAGVSNIRRQPEALYHDRPRFFTRRHESKRLVQSFDFVWGCRPPRPRYRGGPRTPSPATRGLPQLAGNPALKPTPHPPGRTRGLRPQLAGTRPQAAARAPSGRSWLANVLMCVWIFSGTGYSFARFAVTRPNRLQVLSSFVFFGGKVSHICVSLCV